jgi:hypothetical protein
MQFPPLLTACLTSGCLRERVVGEPVGSAIATVGGRFAAYLETRVS